MAYTHKHTNLKSFFYLRFTPGLWFLLLPMQILSYLATRYVYDFEPDNGFHIGSERDYNASVSLPYGPFTVRGLGLKSRIGLWGWVMWHLLEQANDWYWFRMVYKAGIRDLFVCLFRGWKFSWITRLLLIIWAITPGGWHCAYVRGIVNNRSVNVWGGCANPSDLDVYDAYALLRHHAFS